MSIPQHITRKKFLARLRRSKLLTEAQFDHALRELPMTESGRPIARALVERGLLTRFQAERLLVGHTAGFLLGQYRILDQLGRGGMGRVFKAEHVTMKRIVALKVLTPMLMQTDRAQELFLREVRAIAQLVHPNIVTAYDANEDAGRYYLVLEYVDGPNLDQLVRKQGPLPVGLACDYMKQAANGLQAAHALGMLHRDIKPANILVQRRGLQEHSPGLIKISDFGLARLHSPETRVDAPNHAGTILTRNNTVMGTPDFLSPEQARNLHKTDIRSDLYSLGGTFYFLLTGQVPFPGGTALEKLIRHSAEKPAPIPDLRPDAPAEVAEIAMRLLAKHPDDRYSHPEELAAALQPYAVSGPTPWAPAPMPSSPYLDGAVTPVSAASPSSESVLEYSCSDEISSALSNTEPPDLAPTPIIVSIRSLPRASEPLSIASRHWLTVLLWIVAIIVSLIAALAVLARLNG
jgi:eukaryotic-like serine/threonine-protein kinase